MIEQIGTIAGKIWSYLNENEQATTSKLSQELGESDRAILMGIGWLAREDKLIFSTQGRSTYIALKTSESEQTVSA